jgi:hypothetical protein
VMLTVAGMIAWEDLVAQRPKTGGRPGVDVSEV